MSEDYSVQELMASVMARELRDAELAIMGAVSALPQAACRLAIATHAPNLWYITGGSGAVNPRGPELVASSCDERLLEAETALPLPEVVLLEGRGDAIDVFFAGGLEIDPYGGCNLVAVGEQARPKLRGPGGVGLSFLPLAGRVVVYTLAHTPRTFVEKLSFLSGRGATSVVVTPLCVFEPHPETRRLRIRSVHPGVGEEQVRDATGFRLEPSQPPLRTTPTPSPRELAALRGLDPAGLWRSA